MLARGDIAAMAGKVESTFNPKAFLATAGPGHSVSDLRKDGVVFLQATAADAVFYIQKGKIKIVVASEPWNRRNCRAVG